MSEDNPVVKETLEIVGKKDGDAACEVCQDVDEESVHRIKHSGRSIDYEFKDIDTEGAKKLLNEEKIKGNKVPIPVVRKCNIHKDGKKDCTTIVGEPTKKDWVDMELDSLDSEIDSL